MIKNDTWINQTAAKGMIQPFEPSLIRQIEVDSLPSPRPVISYGLSSYGYDIRLSPAEFRIFRHIPGTVVDPKNFNPKNLELAPLQIEANGDYYILPAHSYGLGVALEKLQVPQNISVICIGKSTYARCFRGDTAVALVDGTAPTLAEMANRAERGEQFWGYSVSQHGQVMVSLLAHPRYIGRDSLLKMTLDNNQSIFCTPDHLFMRRSGRMTPAHELRPNDSLMPLYLHLARGYERVYHQKTAAKLKRDFEWRQTFCQNQEERALVASAFKDSSPSESGKNHKVVSIKDVSGVHDVYCLTAPEAGNFALAAGVFVHNCGIIANLTPAEAGWRGHLTLEFSNSSSADCRIYANEGVVQLLFLEGEPCEVSYETRRGKYQDQPESVTIARI